MGASALASQSASESGALEAGCCVDALGAVRDNGHVAVLTEELLIEWKEHASQWSTLWLTEMISANRTAEYDASGLPDRPELRRRVLEAAQTALKPARSVKTCS